MTDLSPAARAVLKAACIHHGLFNEEIIQRRRMIAAALRAAADQVVSPALEEEFFDRNHALPLQKMVEIRLSLLAIAAELEGSDD
jgi:hypothetical protein